MAYYGLVTKLNNVHKDPNSDRLYLGECFYEGVIVGPNSKDGDTVLYLPSDGQIERWFGDKLTLFRKNLDGTPQGGYVENNGHVRAIKLRGNHSSGIVIPLDKIYAIWGDQGWNDGDKVSTINGEEFCRKYIPHRNFKKFNSTPKTSYRGKKLEEIVYPEFDMHVDTEQLAYNYDKFREGDEIEISLKLHGTSGRSANTYAQLPRGFFRRLFHMKHKTKPAYVCGTRRTVVKDDGDGGYYGNDGFRLTHHKRLKDFVEPGMEIFYEIVGYYGPKETDTIMPIGNNKKLNDKNFVKQYGDTTVFNYGCKPGESEIYVYRITANNGKIEYTPDQIAEWCNKAGVKKVPTLETFTFTTEEDLRNRVDKYFEDLTDPIGKTHIKEGVVVRILNRRTFTAFKSKTYEFKVLEGIIKESSVTPDMEEAEALI